MWRWCAAEIVAAGAKAGRKPLLALALALGLGGCTSVLSNLPTQLGGEPAGTPAAQTAGAPTAYPAVHDMPPARQNTVLSLDEQKQATAELVAQRTKQEKQAAANAKDKDKKNQ